MIPLCANCGAPIVRGLYLPWTHANAYRGRGHYAKPAPGTYVSPLRSSVEASSVLPPTSDASAEHPSGRSRQRV